MGNIRKYKQTKIQENDNENNKHKTRSVAKRILRNSYSKEELSISLNEKNKKKLHEISKMVNNVLLKGNIEYQDVLKSINELKNIRLNTTEKNEIVLCDKNIHYLNTIQTVIFSDSIMSETEILLNTNEISNDIVSSEVITNENNEINRTVQLRSEKNKLNKCFETLNETIINEAITVNCIEELDSGINENKNNQIDNNEIDIINTETTINEITMITAECSSKTKENINNVENIYLPIIKKTIIDVDYPQPTVLEESEIIEINSDSSQETFCSELESRLVISQCKINTNKNIATSEHNPEFNQKSHISNNTSDCSNLIHFNSKKQISKTAQATKTQQFNYSPDESSAYSEQFLYYSKQKILNANQNSEILDNNLKTCADFSHVTTINKTIPEINNTLDNSIPILSHQNVNNSDDIIPESVNTDSNLIQDNTSKITEHNDILNNTVNTEKTISNEIIFKNTVSKETENSIPEIEDISCQINERAIPTCDQSNELLENFQYDKNKSVLMNIRKYQDVVAQKLSHFRESYKNSDDRIFTFEQDDKIDKIKFKSLFQKRNENNSTLLKTNKTSPKNTNLDVYQDVEKFLNHQNRTESLDDKDKIHTLTQMNLKELMYNWKHIKHNYSEN